MNPHFFSLSTILVMSLLNVTDQRARADTLDLITRISQEENQ